MNIQLNIYLNIQRHLKCREYLKNIHLNIYCHFKWRWIYQTLVIQAIHEYLFEYSSGYDPQMRDGFSERVPPWSVNILDDILGER